MTTGEKMLLRDHGLEGDKNEVCDMLMKEDQAQLAKWGYQQHDVFRWLAFLTEEVGELSEAVSEQEFRNGEINAITKEAIQVATLAIKIALMTKEYWWK